MAHMANKAHFVHERPIPFVSFQVFKKKIISFVFKIITRFPFIVFVFFSERSFFSVKDYRFFKFFYDRSFIYLNDPSRSPIVFF